MYHRGSAHSTDETGEIPVLYAPASLHPVDALLVFLEEMQVGGLLEDCQLEKLYPSTEARRGHVLKYRQSHTGRQLRFDTTDLVNIQELEPGETALTYEDGIQALRRLIASLVRYQG